MAKRLLRSLTFLWLFSVLLLGVNGRGMSQSLGDIAFVEVSSSTNSFIIGIQNDLPANTTIFFTDSEWDGESFSNEGGIIRWQTGDEVISSGTIIFFEEINSNEVKVSTGSAYGSGIDIRKGDRSLLAYTGTDWQIPSSLLAANIGEYSNNRQEKLKNTDLWEQLERDIVNMPVQVADTNQNERIDIKEGMKLLSNPFAQSISVAALKEVLRKTGSELNGHVYIWNPEFGKSNGRFEPLASQETIAPFQAFWVYFKDGNIDGLRFNRAELVAGEVDQPERSNNIVGNLKIQLGDGEQFDQYGIEFRSEGEAGEDDLDVYKLFSLQRRAINIFSTTETNDRLARNAIPHRLEEQLQIPLLFSAPERDRLTFNWEIPDNLPRDWDFLLLDRETDREIDLRTTNSYSFDLDEIDTEKNNSAEISNPQIFKDKEERDANSRFTLLVGPSGAGDDEINQETTESIQLKPNYPNPFTNSTTIPFELAEETEVSLTVWNMIGQKVETLTEGPRGAGSHDDVIWNASNMPSGMYIIRLEADGEVFTRKVTLIK
ncbi:T9SS type A sorting domain-containing protein [Aliifodinibius salicampi]|uniref:T9SS type A sorting domain-containing protein n=1 Tax=Fodinibius salicampi TaxID=1920655 RepID=A0ABT3PUT3_9BACT|nr:T9SS type A sorting domain-containing protein [Fodinibius salicampi]MCW9711607.1 T9SS type A sorting domain-containing protein [Fodinibius salicampi]